MSNIIIITVYIFSLGVQFCLCYVNQSLFVDGNGFSSADAQIILQEAVDVYGCAGCGHTQWQLTAFSYTRGN